MSRMKHPRFIIAIVAAVAMAVFFGRIAMSDPPRDQAPPADVKLESATLGSGCFWCTEAVFQELEGVYQVKSGYSGGETVDPTYEQVCDGNTGHAEVVQITFDPAVVSYAELLEVFWKTHDPTTLNRQGADVGTQYRSVIFHHNDQQRQSAEQYKKKLDASGAFLKPVVTEIAPLKKFYLAEESHQDFYARNPRQGYCQFVLVPKLDKLKEVFADKLKKK